MRNLADFIKSFMLVSWRSSRRRSSETIETSFMRRMHFLQCHIRLCTQRRRHIRDYVLMPYLWEVETTILGAGIGMQADEINAEVEHHRNIWDLKQRLREARQLSELDPTLDSFLQQVLQPSSTSNNNKCIRPSGRNSICTLDSLDDTRDPNKSQGVDAELPILASKQNDGCTSIPKLSARPDIGPFGNMLSKAGRIRVSDTNMEVIDSYRLDLEARQDFVRSMLRRKVECWWRQYKEYQEACEKFKERIQIHRFQTGARCAISAEMQSLIPRLPPNELTKVDVKVLTGEVAAKLKATPAGRLLNAKAQRRSKA